MTSTAITITKLKGYGEKYNRNGEARPEGRCQRVDQAARASTIDNTSRNGAAIAVIIHGNQQCSDTGGQLVAASKSKLKYNEFQIREELWEIKLEDCGDVETYALRLDQKVQDYNLCAEPSPTASPTDTLTSTTSANTIAKMTDEEHIIYLLRGIPRNDD
ncbi:hypothetical protein K440DRAFT_641235 [Wilcoxina mikolae CBS 423.85]|nr:hypothetical protein K440DRAFT_641235 [Wilcoxina mikolae CBS 423.85]